MQRVKVLGFKGTTFLGIAIEIGKQRHQACGVIPEITLPRLRHQQKLS